MEELDKAIDFKESAYIVHEVQNTKHQELRNSSEMTFEDGQLSKIKGSPTFEIHMFKTLQKDRIKGNKCILY